MATIRENLVNAINDLNKLLLITETDAQRAQIRIDRLSLYRQLEDVIFAELNHQDEDVKAALEEVESLAGLADEAKRDIQKIEKLFKKVAKAVKAIEKAVKAAGKIL